MRWLAAVLVLSVPPLAGGGAGGEAAPPPPDLPSPGEELSEARVDALPAGDLRRPELLLDLALHRHAEAGALEAEERSAHAAALARWREAGARGAPPALATPRADGQRAEAVRLALRALEEAARGDGSFRGAPEALLVAGLDAGRIGRAREAIRALAAVVRGYPESRLVPDAWLALGEHHLAGGDLTRARAAFEVAARTGRPEVRAWAASRLAEAALGATDADGAVAALARGLEAGSAEALGTLVRLIGSAGRLAAFGPAALLRLAELCERSGDPGGALALRERAAREAPRDPAVVAARLELTRLRRALAPVGPPPPPARVTLRPSAASAPPAPRERGEGRGEGQETTLRLGAFAGAPRACHELALAALEEGEPATARLLLERASAGPGDPSAAVQNDLAVALFATGDLAAARAALERAAALAPGLAAAQENLGALALAEGDPAGARPPLERAVALEPARWQARLLHARALAALGRGDEALAEAERVLDLERGQPEALQLVVGLRERAAPAGATGGSPSAEVRDKVAP